MKTLQVDVKYQYLLLVIILVNATSFFGSIIEPDGALYAYIAKQMAQHNDFINLYNSTDWLDKPHFPFWITAISFKVLGINSFAYKLPAFLFWLAGLYYLYKLGKEIYNRQTAIVSVLIYATALQAVIGLFDVRAEHYLTALTIGSIYFVYKLYNTGKIKYVWLAALFSACLVMTKGIFFLSTIGSGLGLLIVVTKDWKQFANYRWYLYLLLTIIFIIPELYCLYVQFDLHPEKVIYGKTNVSGLQFFFWDSQFGRFLNTGPIKGKGDSLFFFHTILWAFLPWSILLYTAIVRLIREKKVLYRSSQWIVVGSAGFTFLIFSLSKFQLPFYIIVLFPQFSLLGADYLVSKQTAKGIRFFAFLQRLLLMLSLLVVGAVSVIFGLPQYGWILLGAILIAALFFYLSQKNNLSSVMCLGIGFSVVITLFLNLFFYPALLQYQSGEVAGKWFNKNVNAPTLALFKDESFSLKFYTNCRIIVTDTLLATTGKSPSTNYYFTSKKNVDSLAKTGLPVVNLQSFPNFHVSKLTGTFLYKKLRSSQLDTTIIFSLRR